MSALNTLDYFQKSKYDDISNFCQIISDLFYLISTCLTVFNYPENLIDYFQNKICMLTSESDDDSNHIWQISSIRTISILVFWRSEDSFLDVFSSDFVLNNLIKSFSSSLSSSREASLRLSMNLLYDCIVALIPLIILNLSFDIAFMSASSWDLRGITTPDPDKVPVKEAAVQSANKAVLICDSSKYAQYATYLAVPLDKINMLISDVNLSELAQRNLIKQGIELSLV